MDQPGTQATVFKDNYLLGLSLQVRNLYVLPSTLRKARDGDFDRRLDEITQSHPGTALAGFAYGLIHGVIATHAPIIYATAQKPKLLLVPIATNIISGVYEMYRKGRSHAGAGEQEA